MVRRKVVRPQLRLLGCDTNHLGYPFLDAIFGQEGERVEDSLVYPVEVVRFVVRGVIHWSDAMSWRAISARARLTQDFTVPGATIFMSAIWS